MNILFILVPVIFFGAFVDAIAGGGGLITLTAYVAAGLPPQVSLGTNKFASSFGTTIASIQYIRRGAVARFVALVAIPASFLGSSIGSALAERYASATLSYLLIVLVPAIAIFMVVNPTFGQARERSKSFVMIVAALLSLLLGCYDGFFGPGTGMLLALAFTSLLGLDLLTANGTARLVNLSSNLAAMAVFLYHGSVDFSVAIPCAAASIVGGFVGSRLALKVGPRLVKPIMLFVLALLLAKVIFDLF
ncbi:MAG TPA: TSUP family transporter [Sphaerochaeta sp.]|nr:TSUP family transporter [Sphaerochaeta sp.]